MSYENAYVPLEPGLNLICGPNGAGKSSILLGISVVLGQAYTERARRLSDLIRWKAPQAKITLHFDNSGKAEKRSFPSYHVDTVTVSRILKRNGTYYYLIQEKPVPKTVLTEAFNQLGLNPDNMLVIMHQLMVGKFASTSPQDKLKMLEEAVGFQSYRKDVLEADLKLKKAVGEEQSLAQILESTKETHEFWRREYEKFLRKRELENRLAQLRRELLWGRIQKRSLSVKKLEERIASRKRMIDAATTKLEETEETAKTHQSRYGEIREKIHELEERRLEAARAEASELANLAFANRILSSLTEAPATHLPDALVKELKETVAKSETHAAQLKEKFGEVNEKLGLAAQRLEANLSRLVEAKVESQVLAFKKKLLLEQLNDLETQLKLAHEELQPLIAEAEKGGPEIESPGKILDIMVEIGAMEEQLKPLAHLGEDTERMYNEFANRYRDLTKKAEEVARNRDELIAELEKRLLRWREVLSEFLESLGLKYNLILGEVKATGELRISSLSDIDRAGLEILVGYKGAVPTSLDSFGQSGGERSIAMMAFLLALQQHITSPFRAIDEFDVHMDPRNREIVSRLIVASAKSLGGGQYVAITPGQVHVENEDVHVIVVQNVEGSSVVTEVR